MDVMPYKTPWWLCGGHLQTLYPLLRKPLSPPLRRERLDSPDGDFIDIDWLDAPSPAAPLLVLFHGLEGSSRSHYARGLLNSAARHGWRLAIPHFRGCSGEPNRLPRAYHSGDSDEIHWLLQHFATLLGNTAPLFAVGVSLGGNALLKWLGEQADSARPLLQGAVAVCPPLDLTICGHALARGSNRLYTRHFLNTLKPKALGKLQRFPGLFDAHRLRSARSLHAFDDVYTGPVHGFSGADEYWHKASSRPWLSHITVPSLLLTSANDSFVPPAALPHASEFSPWLQHEHHRQGGHVGFVAGHWPGHLEWLPQRILHFLGTAASQPLASDSQLPDTGSFSRP